MEEIFSICGTLVYGIKLVRKWHEEIIGYIVDETREKWRVQLINNEVKCMNKLEFDTTSGEYMFVLDIENDMYITKY